MGASSEGIEPHIRNVSTGSLPSGDEVRAAVDEAYETYRHVDEGELTAQIPALAGTERELFGICVAGASGRMYSIGDATVPFTMQSISKAFVFALVCEEVGPQEARRMLGANNTGLPYDSVMAIELSRDQTLNPMVNAGAIATTSLTPGATPEQRWEFILDGLSRFAGRPLSLDRDVYESEVASNLRNEGIAHLMDAYDRMYSDPVEATDLYTKHCSLLVTTEDLAVMGSTLADGGVNPLTGVRVVSADVSRHVLAVLATAGMYELSGDWLYDVGLPGKSGISGGIVTIIPGKGGVGVYSPPLDPAGNSVRGRLVTRYLSEELGLNLFTSVPLS